MTRERPVQLNIDLGEGTWESPELYRLAHRVSIACGGHAGDPASMRASCQLAIQGGALVGAHPSYPDRGNFGRKRMEIALEALRGALIEQLEAMRAAATSAGTTVAHVKAHGALYHVANDDPAVARVLVDALMTTVERADVIGPPEGALRDAALAVGLRFLSEGFADRAYGPDGRLLDRSHPDALIREPLRAAAQARLLMESDACDTICVHADTAGAVEIARAVRETLAGAD